MDDLVALVSTTTDAIPFVISMVNGEKKLDASWTYENLFERCTYEETPCQRCGLDTLAITVQWFNGRGIVNGTYHKSSNRLTSAYKSFEAA